MYGYTGASMVASQVTPFVEPPQTTSDNGTSSQADAVAKAAATPASQAATVAQNAASSAPATTTQTAATTAVPAATPPTTARRLAHAALSKHRQPIPHRRSGRQPDERQSECNPSIHGAVLFRSRSRKLRLRSRPAVDSTLSGGGTIQPGWCKFVADAGPCTPGRHRGRKRRAVYGQQRVGRDGRGQYSRAAIGARELARDVARGGGRSQAGQRRTLCRTAVEWNAQRYSDVAQRRPWSRCWTPRQRVHREVRGQAFRDAQAASWGVTRQGGGLIRCPCRTAAPAVGCRVQSPGDGVHRLGAHR